MGFDGGEELEFLDGTFVVPDHVAAMMSGLDTTKYRYQQALDVINGGMMGEFLGKVQQDTLKRHFEELRSDGHSR